MHAYPRAKMKTFKLTFVVVGFFDVAERAFDSLHWTDSDPESAASSAWKLDFFCCQLFVCQCHHGSALEMLNVLWGEELDSDLQIGTSLIQAACARRPTRVNRSSGLNCTQTLMPHGLAIYHQRLVIFFALASASTFPDLRTCFGAFTLIEFDSHVNEILKTFAVSWKIHTEKIGLMA